MDSVRDLYQDMILDHNRDARNFRVIQDANAKMSGKNPLCGDMLVMYAKFDGERIVDLSFQGEGCAISIASASLLTEMIMGKSKDEARACFQDFLELMTSEKMEDVQVVTKRLGKLIAFSGVRDYPSRVKCAMLAWRTLEAILDGKTQGISM